MHISDMKISFAKFNFEHSILLWDHNYYIYTLQITKIHSDNAVDFFKSGESLLSKTVGSIMEHVNVNPEIK